MESSTMHKLAHFKIMARRLGGFNVDIFRMAQEPTYARQMLHRPQEGKDVPRYIYGARG